MFKTVNSLPDEVGKKYRVLRGRPFKFVHPQLGAVDLNKATLPQVERIIDKGVGHIVAVKDRKKKLRN